MKNTKRPQRKETQKGGKLLPAILRVIGTLILVFVIVVCIPLTVPRLMGFKIFNVISGSMEPEIPVGSVVYVKQVDASKIEEGEIVAFLDGDSTVTHRVTENRRFAGKLITKGDANETDDFEPVEYESVIGRVEHHIPMIGGFMAVLSSTVGKLYMLCFAACGAMFNMLGTRIREHNESRETDGG